jgi:hypothetical protein
MQLQIQYIAATTARNFWGCHMAIVIKEKWCKAKLCLAVFSVYKQKLSKHLFLNLTLMDPCIAV